MKQRGAATSKKANAASTESQTQPPPTEVCKRMDHLNKCLDKTIKAFNRHVKPQAEEIYAPLKEADPDTYSHVMKLVGVLEGELVKNMWEECQKFNTESDLNGKFNRLEELKRQAQSRSKARVPTTPGRRSSSGGAVSGGGGGSGNESSPNLRSNPEAFIRSRRIHGKQMEKARLEAMLAEAEKETQPLEQDVVKMVQDLQNVVDKAKSFEAMITEAMTASGNPTDMEVEANCV